MKISNLTKSFENFSLNIDEMTLEPGGIFGLIGGNGCGKSTLVKLMAGILPPDGGSIDREGLTGREITMVPRRPYLLHGSVYENLIYPLKLRKIKPDKSQIEHWLELAGLSDKQSQYAPSLSGGEQQKLALIRALSFSPKLIFLDEAMSNLDIESGFRFEALIAERQRERPATWLIVSHRIPHIRRLCERVFFMDDGKLLADGSTEDVLSRPKEPALIRYLQSEAITSENLERNNGTS